MPMTNKLAGNLEVVEQKSTKSVQVVEFTATSITRNQLAICMELFLLVVIDCAGEYGAAIRVDPR